MKVSSINSFLLRDILAYVMIPVIQHEADKFMLWNNHRIRAQKDTVLPCGVPNHIHSFPENYQLQQCGKLCVAMIFKYNYLFSNFNTTNDNLTETFYGTTLVSYSNYAKKHKTKRQKDEF